MALLIFNLDVELGRLLLIAAVLSFIILRRYFRFLRVGSVCTPYAICTVAMFWFIQRVTAFSLVLHS